MMTDEHMDRYPRMIDTVDPDSLNTDACAKLASEILLGIAHDYIIAMRRYRKKPTQENQRNLQRIRRRIKSDYYANLSAGLVSPQAVMDELNRQV